jgi:serine/threonine-protein kinase
MWNVRIARRKVRLFEQCQHPSIVPFVDVGTSGGMHYLAWPFVEGTPLDKLIEQQGPLSPEQTVQYLIQAVEGLDQCHKNNLLHGLLKPSNLMLGGDGQVRILDFGIGCLLAETEGESLVDTMSTANSVNSGLDCASPESIMDPSNLSPVGDQYSLGCVLYYCLSGRYPFPDGTAVEKMMAHQQKQATSILGLNPHVPDGLVAILERLMQKSPIDRYPSCTELLAALRALSQPAQQAAPVRRATVAVPRARLSRPDVSLPSSLPTGPVSTSAPASSRPVAPSTMGGRAQPTLRAQPPAAKSTPAARNAPAESDEAEEAAPEAPPLTLGQRLGTSGVILVAAVAGIAAYGLSYLISMWL